MSDSGVKRPGRPRDSEVHEAVLEATRSLLLEAGYHRLTIEAVASRAATSRSTIYRWWPSLGALVLEAVGPELTIDAVPDSGDSAEDIRAAIRQLVATFSRPLARLVIQAVVANLDDDPTMAASFRETWVYPWRVTATDALQRARRRGDLVDGFELDELLDVIVGTVFQRTVTRATPATEGLEDVLVRLLIDPAR
jgi:AcrR family transcriptional regulator